MLSRPFSNLRPLNLLEMHEEHLIFKNLKRRVPFTLGFSGVLTEIL
jgi:hypothetical protein